MKHLLLISAALVLTGCISVTDAGNMKANVTEATAISENSSLYNAISLGDVTGGNKSNVSMNTKISNTELSDAIFESLAGHKMLARENGAYKLDAKLIKLKQPVAGLDWTVSSTIQYILTDTKTKETVFDQTISEAFTAAFGDQFIGFLRAKMAVEGAISANVASMLEQLVQTVGADNSAKMTFDITPSNRAP